MLKRARVLICSNAVSGQFPPSPTIPPELGFAPSKIQHLTLAAGSSSGESYILGNALKKVVERHYPKMRITLLETNGTVENLQMLEDGRAQLAAAQSNIPPGPTARILAVLYDDTFQLLVLKDSPIHRFSNLRGERIALAKTGGQFRTIT